jgi:spermidine/putrescine transport system permease protein
MKILRISLLTAVLSFLYLPVLVLVLYSFNASRFAAGWEGFSLKWYEAMFRSQENVRALVNTGIVSVVSTLISTLLGTLLALGLYRYRFRGKEWVETLLYLPVIVPEMVTAVSMLAFFVALQVTLGKTTVILAHIAFQISFVTLTVRGRLQHFPANLIEAARDLGAGTQALGREVLWPLLRPGIISGALLAFSLSVDDFLITYFTAGVGDSTLPVRMYALIRRGVTPEVNALSALMLMVSFLTLFISLRTVRAATEAPR